MVAKHQTIHSALSLVLKQTYFVNIEKAYTVSLGMPFERCIAAMGHQIPVSVWLCQLMWTVPLILSITFMDTICRFSQGLGDELLSH